MALLLSFERAGNKTAVTFHTAFPCSFTAALDNRGLLRLGKTLQHLAKGRKRRAAKKLKAVAEWGAFDFTLSAVRTDKAVRITVTNCIKCKEFSFPTDCESIYEGVDIQAVLKFGEQLERFEQEGKAFLYGCDIHEANPFYDEYNKSRRA